MRCKSIAHAIENGWSSIVGYACVRDARALRALSRDTVALNMRLTRSAQPGEEQRSFTVHVPASRFGPDTPCTRMPVASCWCVRLAKLVVRNDSA